MKKQYSRKQIQEAIAYWKGVLKRMDEAQGGNVSPAERAVQALDGMPCDPEIVDDNTVSLWFGDRDDYYGQTDAISDALVGAGLAGYSIERPEDEDDPLADWSECLLRLN